MLFPDWWSVMSKNKIYAVHMKLTKFTLLLNLYLCVETRNLVQKQFATSMFSNQVL